MIKSHPEGARITRISYGVGVPIDRLKVMLEALSSYGLILTISDDDEDDIYYGVTPRGQEFLETYWKMKGFLASFSEDSQS